MFDKMAGKTCELKYTYQNEPMLDGIAKIHIQNRTEKTRGNTTFVKLACSMMLIIPKEDYLAFAGEKITRSKLLRATDNDIAITGNVAIFPQRVNRVLKNYGQTFDSIFYDLGRKVKIDHSTFSYGTEDLGYEEYEKDDVIITKISRYRVGIVPTMVPRKMFIEKVAVVSNKYVISKESEDLNDWTNLMVDDEDMFRFYLHKLPHINISLVQRRVDLPKETLDKILEVAKGSIPMAKKLIQSYECKAQEEK